MIEFKINDPRELEKFQNWMKTRKKANSGPIGGRYTYSFTPTGLGVIIVIKDGITGDEIDITDYDSW